MIENYRKKPVVVQAFQWFLDLGEVGGVRVHRPERGNPDYIAAAIKTLEGWATVTPGDWIITGIKGEKYPCKPDIFAETYEKDEE